MTIRMLWFILPISSLFYLPASVLSSRIREVIDVQINAGYLLSELLPVFYLLIIYLPIYLCQDLLSRTRMALAYSCAQGYKLSLPDAILLTSVEYLIGFSRELITRLDFCVRIEGSRANGTSRKKSEVMTC